MTPKLKIFEGPFIAYVSRDMIYVSWPNLVKVRYWEIDKVLPDLPHIKADFTGVVRTPILPPVSRSRPKFSQRYRPLTCACRPMYVLNNARIG